jgi:hypothetical protein
MTSSVKIIAWRFPVTGITVQILTQILTYFGPDLLQKMPGCCTAPDIHCLATLHLSTDISHIARQSASPGKGRREVRGPANQKGLTRNRTMMLAPPTSVN